MSPEWTCRGFPGSFGFSQERGSTVPLEGLAASGKVRCVSGTLVMVCDMGPVSMGHASSGWPARVGRSRPWRGRWSGPQSGCPVVRLLSCVATALVTSVLSPMLLGGRHSGAGAGPPRTFPGGRETGSPGPVPPVQDRLCRKEPPEPALLPCPQRLPRRKLWPRLASTSTVASSQPCFASSANPSLIPSVWVPSPHCAHSFRFTELLSPTIPKGVHVRPPSPSPGV